MAGGTKPGEEPQHPGEITTLKEFRQAIARAEGVIVIAGTNPPRAHTTLCDLLSDDRFNQNVIMRESGRARYYLRGSLVDARREFGAVPCKKCKPAETIRFEPGWR